MSDIFKIRNQLKFILTALLVLVVAFPFLAFAQPVNCPPGEVAFGGNCVSNTTSNNPVVCTGDGLGNLICKFQQILNSIIPVLVALGVVYFVWGVVRYVIADGEEAKKKGRDSIIYGIIAFATITGLWGLVYIVVRTFGLSSVAPSFSPLIVKGGSSTCSLIGHPKLQDLLCYVTKIINDSVIPLIFAISTVYFIWVAVKFIIINAKDEAKREQGRHYMIGGILALAAMVSIWGLVAILGATFNVDTKVIPQVCPPNGCKP